MRCAPCTWEAQRTVGSPVPEKVERAVAWGSGALGIPDGEQMVKGCSGSGTRISPWPRSLEKATMNTFHESDVGQRGKGLCWVDVGPITQESRIPPKDTFV